MMKNNPQSSANDSAVLGAWRQLSDDYLRDVEAGRVSALSKEDLAFEAGYLSALVVIGVEQAKAYRHPDARALQDAAATLQWPAETMNLAVGFLEQRYTRLRDGGQADALLAWAHSVRNAASDGEGLLPLTAVQHDAIVKAEPKGATR